MVKYEGLFFDKETESLILALDKERLDVGIDVLHCTFKYLPSEEEIFDDIVGNYYFVDIVGYGYDKDNSGFCVKLPDELLEYYINFDYEEVLPHITSSLSLNGESENTRNLVFSYFDEPVRVRCRFGYYIKDDNGKTYVSYDKFSVI